MSTGESFVGNGRPEHEYHASDSEEITKEEIGIYTTDLEGKKTSERTTTTEIVPVEAFKVNVEGDQSPCQQQTSSNRER